MSGDGRAPIVALRDLALGYGGARVLEGVSLSVPRGSFMAIVGPSGVGKSTLLRVVAGLMPPDAGEVRLQARPDPARRPTALVFQDARLLPWRRVLGNVSFGLEGLALDRGQRRGRAQAALATVGLPDQGGRWPHQLSGGQRQRVAIARALAVRPDLLLVDEPFGALDAITRRLLQDELLRIWRETEASVMFVTHDLDEAVYLADTVVLLGSSPARIVRTLEVTLARPRQRDAAVLGKQAGELRQALGETFAQGEGI